jgi:hypothetical protein
MVKSIQKNFNQYLEEEAKSIILDVQEQQVPAWNSFSYMKKKNYKMIVLQSTHTIGQDGSNR